MLARNIAGIGYTPNPFGLWATVTQGVVRNRDLSLIDAARVFALVSVALTDGLQTTHTSKFVYGLWRPITAIRRRTRIFNDLTTADPEWTPLIPTPAYPSHASNVACIGTSAARTLARLFKTDAVPFTMTWTGTGGNTNVSRSYSSFSKLAEEAEARSRMRRHSLQFRARCRTRGVHESRRLRRRSLRAAHLVAADLRTFCSRVCSSPLRAHSADTSSDRLTA